MRRSDHEVTVRPGRHRPAVHRRAGRGRPGGHRRGAGADRRHPRGPRRPAAGRAVRPAAVPAGPRPRGGRRGRPRGPPPPPPGSAELPSAGDAAALRAAGVLADPLPGQVGQRGDQAGRTRRRPDRRRRAGTPRAPGPTTRSPSTIAGGPGAAGDGGGRARHVQIGSHGRTMPASATAGGWRPGVVTMAARRTSGGRICEDDGPSRPPATGAPWGVHGELHGGCRTEVRA